MKKSARLEYLLLNDLQEDIPNRFQSPCLCVWCRYSEWEGCCCDETYPVCHHPLQAVQDLSDNNEAIWEGADCWGFKPMYRREDCVDAVGLWLQGKYVDFDSMTKIGKAKTKTSGGA